MGGYKRKSWNEKKKLKDYIKIDWCIYSHKTQSVKHLQLKKKGYTYINKNFENILTQL